jgi:acyl carrier protein
LTVAVAAGTIPAMNDDLAADVRAVVAEALDLPAGEIAEDQELADDLGVDSLGMIQIRVGLEHALGVRAPDDIDVDEARSIRTVRDLIALVEAELR